MGKTIRLGLLLSIGFLISCSYKIFDKKVSEETPQKPSVRLSVMSYNVENFFDLEHTVEAGVDKNDYQYLPINYPGKVDGCVATNSAHYLELCKKTNWDLEKFNHKLEMIKRAVLASGSRPDILGLSEIENAFVVNKIKESLGYSDYVVTQSPDSRGIDVAILYNSEKLTYLDHTELTMEKPFYNGKGTRNLLGVHFIVKGVGPRELLGVYMNHWPSQGNTDTVREEVALQLKALVDSDFDHYGLNYKTIIMGDFNTVDNDSPYALGVIEDSRWSHKMIDIEIQRDQTLGRPKGEPEGSYYFTGDHTWNRLDRIYVSSNLLAGEKSTADLGSFDIVNEDFMVYKLVVNKGGKKEIVSRPNAYNHQKDDLNQLGVSDHFPVKVDFIFNP